MCSECIYFRKQEMTLGVGFCWCEDSDDYMDRVFKDDDWECSKFKINKFISG